MADNDTLADGKILALDDVGGVMFQRVKVTAGPDGTAHDLLEGGDGVAQTGYLGMSPMVAEESSGLLTRRRSPVDGLATTKLAASGGMVWDETAGVWNKARGNTQITCLASAARTTTTNAPAWVNHSNRGVLVYLNVSAVSGTGGLVPKIFGQDFLTAINYLLWAAAAPITAVGSYCYLLYPGAIGAATADLKEISGIALPRHGFVQIAANDASSYTYSINVSMIL